MNAPLMPAAPHRGVLDSGGIFAAEHKCGNAKIEQDRAEGRLSLPVSMSMIDGFAQSGTNKDAANHNGENATDGRNMGLRRCC
ncbi:hypothetical protein [Bordetella sp. 02P26C-1]|uniref:hypothetical protein n=1 Tax=Bordetella sp. 02P26C-1 TaxID=2683195 RepID=UPI0013524A1E|nr:hypothetical protein [Bordetella sp. 02P26C-1]MVW80116.1 hypothetical protein [Bordetella sp. 02P26C-1]